MLGKKTLNFALVTSLLLTFFSYNCYADADKAQHALTMEISAPTQLPNLKPGEKPNPVFLQVMINNGSAPVYSAPVTPGEHKAVELKLDTASDNGAQIQFVNNNSGNIQPVSFIYALTGKRLNCLIAKDAKIQVVYNITNKLLDVKGIPADC